MNYKLQHKYALCDPENGGVIRVVKHPKDIADCAARVYQNIKCSLNFIYSKLQCLCVIIGFQCKIKKDDNSLQNIFTIIVDEKIIPINNRQSSHLFGMPLITIKIEFYFSPLSLKNVFSNITVWGVQEAIQYVGQNQKLRFLKMESLADTLFLTKNDLFWRKKIVYPPNNNFVFLGKFFFENCF